MSEPMPLHFSVKGEFVTKTAREMFYQEHDIKKAIELIKGATMNDQMSESEHLMLCLEIISGKKDIVGTYPGDDYGVQDNPEGSFDNVFSEINMWNKKSEHLQNQHEEMMKKFIFICSNLEDWELTHVSNKYYEEYGEFLFDTPSFERSYIVAVNNTSDKDTEMLESYLARQHDDTHYTYSDYGWLEPDGTYHEVDWAEHEEWASDYLENKYPFKEYADMYWKKNSDGENIHYTGGDCLVYCLGWVLLHSPFRGLARATYDEIRGFTNAQKEFLYDYYTERGMHDNANNLYADED